ncbi:MAG: hypothetical protein GY833_04955, partial [Aestuariibacter sp.]|nr:hypothetical protein [Aestuariibacter sp.]
ALTFNKGKDDFFMFAIDFINLVNYSNQELFPDQLDLIANRELCSKLPPQWQKELDKLHQEDGCRATFSYDKEWCLRQQCNDAAFAERKEITKTPVEEKKDPQQNRAKAAGSVQEVQVESAASVKGRRRKDKKDGDDLASEPQLQIDNVTYRQAYLGGVSGQQQQRYYQPLPPLPPPPSYFYQDVPRRNLCPWAPNRNTYTNFNSSVTYYPSPRSSFLPNYMSGPSERFQGCAPPNRSLLADLECYNCHQKGHISKNCIQLHAQ